jgi:hypothetical protein
MADVKISQVAAKGATLEDDDILLIGEYNGSTYDSKSVTGANVRPFKTYLANLSQTGSSAPTANFTYSELTTTLTFARSGAGVYTITSSGTEFTTNKTFINCTLGASAGIVTAYSPNNYTITIITSDVTGTPVDGYMNPLNVEIKIIK